MIRLHCVLLYRTKKKNMRCNTNCLTDWADELDENQSDFSFLSDLIAYADNLVTAEPQLVTFKIEGIQN